MRITPEELKALVGRRGGPKLVTRMPGSSGFRKDLGIYVRSIWEANYARYLTELVRAGQVLSWEYEPRVFEFERIRRGTRSYTPDFLVQFNNGHHEWHEVKGWLDPKSKTKLKRMARYYPGETVVLIDKQWFAKAERSGLSGAIKGWERRHDR